MKKRIIFVLMIVFLTFTVFGLDTCKDIITPGMNCSMLTPTLSCAAYNYQVFNQSGTQVQNGSLSVVNDSIYYFNFSQPFGDYIVKLCDGSTREIQVRNEADNMIIGAIILIPIIFGIILVLAAAFMNPEHSILKMFLFMLSFICFYASMYLGLQSVVKFYNFPELQQVIANIIFWMNIAFILVVLYFIIYIIYLIFANAHKAKMEKLNY